MAPLVFLPGAGGRASFWQPVANRLADLGPLHVFGWPGFGNVPADASIQCLDDLFHWLVSRLPRGPSHVIAQSMGGILAVRLALELRDRVASLVLGATSGGVDTVRMGATDWRPEYLASLPELPRWFLQDRTDFTDRLVQIRAPTLLLWSDADPVSPLSIGRCLADRMPNARLVTIPGGTHLFAQEQPVEVARLIRLHLA